MKGEKRNSRWKGATSATEINPGWSYATYRHYRSLNAIYRRVCFEHTSYAISWLRYFYTFRISRVVSLSLLAAWQNSVLNSHYFKIHCTTSVDIITLFPRYILLRLLYIYDTWTECLSNKKEKNHDESVLYYIIDYVYLLRGTRLFIEKHRYGGCLMLSMNSELFILGSRDTSAMWESCEASS